MAGAKGRGTSTCSTQNSTVRGCIDTSPPEPSSK